MISLRESIKATWNSSDVNEVHENINYVDVPFPLKSLMRFVLHIKSLMRFVLHIKSTRRSFDESLLNKRASQVDIKDIVSSDVLKNFIWDDIDLSPNGGLLARQLNEWQFSLDTFKTWTKICFGNNI